MFSVGVKTSSVTLTLIGLARSCGQGCGKVHFYIMRFSVRARCFLKTTRGSVNEMFTQIPRTPPHGHVIQDDTSVPGESAAVGMCQEVMYDSSSCQQFDDGW